MTGIVVLFCFITAITIYLSVSFYRCWRKERKILRHANEHLRETNRVWKEEFEQIRKKLSKCENGEPCEGRYCQSCSQNQISYRPHA